MIKFKVHTNFEGAYNMHIKKCTVRSQKKNKSRNNTEKNNKKIRLLYIIEIQALAVL